MQNFARNVVLLALAVVAFVVFMVFLTIVLKIALVVALLAFAYYWFTRATQSRRRGRDWR